MGLLSHEGKGMYCTLFHTIKFQMRWRLAVSGGGATRCAGKVPQCSPLLCFVPAVSLIISLSCLSACIQRRSFTQPGARFKTHTSLARHARYSRSFPLSLPT